MKEATLVVLHTTPVTVDVMKQLAAELIPGCRVYNIVDDSILPQLRAANGDLGAVRARWIEYGRIAEQLGADCILEACSSVGELTEEMAQTVSVPVVRVDEGMATVAVEQALRIGIAATMPTTLRPTAALLQATADRFKKTIHLEEALSAAAFDALTSGDAATHDALVKEMLLGLLPKVDIVVLAQASMARIVASLPEHVRHLFLSSPRFAMERTRDALARAIES